MKSSSWARCGVSIMRNKKGFDHVIMAPHCTTWQKNVSLGSTYIGHNAYPRVSCYSYVCKSRYMLDFVRENMIKLHFFYHFCTLQRFWWLRPLLKENDTVNIMAADDLAKSRHTNYLGPLLLPWTHLLLFRVRSWNNDMRCMSFYIL